MVFVRLWWWSHGFWSWYRLYWLAIFIGSIYWMGWLWIIIVWWVIIGIIVTCELFKSNKVSFLEIFGSLVQRFNLFEVLIFFCLESQLLNEEFDYQWLIQTYKIWRSWTFVTNDSCPRFYPGTGSGRSWTSSAGTRAVPFFWGPGSPKLTLAKSNHASSPVKTFSGLSAADGWFAYCVTISLKLWFTVDQSIKYC